MTAGWGLSSEPARPEEPRMALSVDLLAIEERYDEAHRSTAQSKARRRSWQDIPALVAEVRRLRAPRTSVGTDPQDRLDALCDENILALVACQAWDENAKLRVELAEATAQAAVAVPAPPAAPTRAATSARPATARAAALSLPDWPSRDAIYFDDDADDDLGGPADPTPVQIADFRDRPGQEQ
jgi:hypothetical protein